MRMLGSSRPAQLVAIATVAVVMAVSSLLPGLDAGAQDDGLVGDFTVSISSESVPQDIPDGATIVGRWRISFLEGGRYEGERLDLGVLVRGSYSVEGDTVTITDEEGAVSCSNPSNQPAQSGDVSTATYRFEVDSNSLTLTPEQEGCALRRVLLSTTDLVPFVACNTEPIELATAGDGDDEDDDVGARGQGPAPRDVETPEQASPTAEPVADETAEAEATETPEDEPGSTEEQIDELLAQMTACWATGEPERFLALWSDDFRAQFLEEEGALDSLRAAMQVPLTWERAGDVNMDGDDRAEAVVRTTTLDEEEFVRFRFVFENGGWKWDGSAV